LNWLDWVLIAVLTASAASGFAGGFVKIIVGSAALVIGFVGASWFYGVAASWVAPFVDSRPVAAILGFLLILVAALLLGGIIGALLARMMKIAGLSWADRFLGGVVGFLRGGLFLAVIALLLLTFAPRRLPAAVNQSRIAPYILATADLIAEITPYEIKRGFERSYDQLRDLLDDVRRRKRLEIVSE
jgi:membrane protein required for colicin V production